MKLAHHSQSDVFILIRLCVLLDEIWKALYIMNDCTTCPGWFSVCHNTELHAQLLSSEASYLVKWLFLNSAWTLNSVKICDPRFMNVIGVKRAEKPSKTINASDNLWLQGMLKRCVGDWMYSKRLSPNTCINSWCYTLVPSTWQRNSTSISIRETVLHQNSH